MFKTLHDPGALALTVFLDGQETPAYPGETLATVLLRQSDMTSRTTPVDGTPRAPYCLMGVCFDCLVTVDGQPSVQACRTPVAEGMRVERQNGRRGLT